MAFEEDYLLKQIHVALYNRYCIIQQNCLLCYSSNLPKSMQKHNQINNCKIHLTVQHFHMLHCTRMGEPHEHLQSYLINSLPILLKHCFHINLDNGHGSGVLIPLSSRLTCTITVALYSHVHLPVSICCLLKSLGL